MAELFSQILGLSKLDVYSETENNDNSYFDITGRYWQNLDKYNVKEIKKLDDIWEQIF